MKGRGRKDEEVPFGTRVRKYSSSSVELEWGQVCTLQEA